MATIENDAGEKINVLHPDGQLGGNAVLSFILGLVDYCQLHDDDATVWFQHIENKTKTDLCSTAAPLMKAFYVGEWDYEEDEYQFFFESSY